MTSQSYFNKLLPSHLQIYAEKKEISIQRNAHSINITYKEYNHYFKYSSIIMDQPPSKLFNYQQLYPILYKHTIIHKENPSAFIHIHNDQICLRLTTIQNQRVEMPLLTNKEVLYSQQLQEQRRRLQLHSSIYLQKINNIDQILTVKIVQLQNILKDNLKLYCQNLTKQLDKQCHSTYLQQQQKLIKLVKSSLKDFNERCEKGFTNILQNRIRINQEMQFERSKQNQLIKSLKENQALLNGRIDGLGIDVEGLKLSLQEVNEKIEYQQQNNEQIDSQIKQLYAKLQPLLSKNITMMMQNRQMENNERSTYKSMNQIDKSATKFQFNEFIDDDDSLNQKINHNQQHPSHSIHLQPFSKQQKQKKPYPY